MADVFDSLEQVNDTVQQYGFSDKRKRNEAIRAGLSDPGNFSSAGTQPSDFLGAGRKMAANQNPDEGLVSLFGNSLKKTDDGWQYYGDTDYSTAQYGTSGYTTKDLGKGVYDILGSDGASIGKGYYDPSKTLSQLGYSPTSVTANIYEGYGPNSGLSPKYSTTPYDVNNQLTYWEKLGDVLSGNYSSYNDYYASGANLPYNNQNESITGATSLYGSTPLINNNKLLGYVFDPGPGEAFNSSRVDRHDTSGDQNWWTAGTEYGVGEQYYREPFAQTPYEVSTRSLWRELNNPETWNQYGSMINKDKFLLNADSVDKFPGWTNKESSTYQRGQAPKSHWYDQLLSVAPAFLGSSLGLGSGGSALLSSILKSSGALGSLFKSNPSTPIKQSVVPEGATDASLNSLFNADTAIKGSEFGDISGGLGAYLNSTAQGTDTLGQKVEEEKKTNRSV